MAAPLAAGPLLKALLILVTHTTCHSDGRPTGGDERETAPIAAQWAGGWTL